MGSVVWSQTSSCKDLRIVSGTQQVLYRRLQFVAVFTVVFISINQSTPTFSHSPAFITIQGLMAYRNLFKNAFIKIIVPPVEKVKTDPPLCVAFGIGI